MTQTREATTGSDPGREHGQVLVIFALLLMVLLGFAALTIDVGLAYMERRNLQNAVDAAALAAAQDLIQGQSQATVEATAIDYLGRHGYGNPGDFEINIPPTSGAYAGMNSYVEVKAASDAPMAFLGLFRDGPFTLSAHAVAEGKPGSQSGGTGDPPGDGGGGTPPPLPPADVPNVACGSPTVDGRVTASDGYTWIGDLVGGSTDYGDVFYACDGTDLYFAMVLNGPDTGGGVANENVYQCDAKGGAGDLQIQGNTIKKMKGMITSVGASSFTLDINGDIWTVNVDGSTTIEVDKQKPMTINDLAPDMEADVKGDVVGSNEALATQVKAKTVYGACGGAFSSTYHADYNTGWVQSPKGTHTFKDLWKSDRARFQIACDGVARHDFIQDYLTDDGGGSWSSGAADDGEVVIAGPSGSASSMEWNLEHPVETGWGDDPGEDPLIQSPPFNPQYTGYDLEYDGWIWEMIYEFKLSAAPYNNCTGPIQFGLHDFSGSTGPLEGIHSSPAKNDEGVWLQIQASVLRLVE